MTNTSPLSTIAETFERLPPHPPVTMTLWIPNSPGSVSRVGSVDKLFAKGGRGFIQTLPGELFGLPCKDDVRVGVAIAPLWTPEFDALAEHAGRLAHTLSEDGFAGRQRSNAWLAAVIRAALCDPGIFLRPAEGVFVLLDNDVSVERSLVIAFREGQLGVPLPFLTEENTARPWILRFTLSALNLASAELCRRMAAQLEKDSASLEPRSQSRISVSVGMGMAGLSARLAKKGTSRIGRASFTWPC